MGDTLSIDTSNFPVDYTYSYKWERADTLDGTYATVVLSSTSYTLTNNDVGKFIRLTVEYNVDDENITLSTSGIEAMASHGDDDDMGGEHGEGGTGDVDDGSDDMDDGGVGTEVQITPDSELTVNIQLDGYTVGFVRNSLQEDLFSLYGFPVKSSALGSINSNTGDNITLSGFTNSILNGKKILAIERWYDGGWSPSSMGTNVIVGFTGTGLTIENAPILRYKNVLYSPLEVSTPANWGGVTIDGGFQIVRYTTGSEDLHTDFPGGDIFGDNYTMITITRTLSFHDPELTVQYTTTTNTPGLGYAAGYTRNITFIGEKSTATTTSGNKNITWNYLTAWGGSHDTWIYNREDYSSGGKWENTNHSNNPEPGFGASWLTQWMGSTGIAPTFDTSIPVTLYSDIGTNTLWSGMVDSGTIEITPGTENYC